MKKAVFFDVDGTLMNSIEGINEISPRVTAAIKALKAAGHYVFIATGRPYAFMSDHLLEFGFDGFVLANGAQLVMNGETFYMDALEKSRVEKLVAQLETFNIEYILEGEKWVYMKKSFETFQAFYNQVGMPKKYVKDTYDLEEIEINKIETLCPNETALQACLEFLAQDEIYDHCQSVIPMFLEIYSKRNTKATGILKVLEHLNIPIEKSYAFGDGKNDIEMLSTVGCGIAMGNASEEVKQYAKVVTDSVHEDGVALGIEKYILNQ